MTIVDRVWRWLFTVLKTNKLSASLRPGSKLFHSMIVDEKANF